MTDHEIVQALQHYGGSFAQAIARAFLVADDLNRETLRHAFMDLFREYAEIARVQAARVTPKAEA